MLKEKLYTYPDLTKISRKNSSSDDKGKNKDERGNVSSLSNVAFIILAWFIFFIIAFLNLDNIQVKISSLDYFPSQERYIKALQELQQLTHFEKVKPARDKIITSARTIYDFDPVMQRQMLIPSTRPADGWSIKSDGHVIKRVMLVGASSMQFYLGIELERYFEQYKDVEVRRFGKLATGLARPDYFDWNSKIQQLMDEFHPDIVLAQFGGNDCQPMYLPDGQGVKFNTEEWRKDYKRRVESVINIMSGNGSDAIMIGSPNMRKEDLAQRITHVNELTWSVATQKDAQYYSTWELTSDDDGNYIASLMIDGKERLIRLTDGIHLSRHGAQYVARHICDRLEERFTLVPDGDSLATKYMFELPSASRGAETRYYAYVPPVIPEEGLPVLYLLHDSHGSEDMFIRQSHRDLQRLSALHNIIIVLPDGGKDSWYLNSPLVEDNQIESYFIDELMPDVIDRLPANGLHGVAGLEMGGLGALNISIKNPVLFHSCSSINAYTNLSKFSADESLTRLLGNYALNKKDWNNWSPFHIVSSRQFKKNQFPILITTFIDNPENDFNNMFHFRLRQQNIKHDFKEIKSPDTYENELENLKKHIGWHARILHSLDSPINRQNYAQN